MKDMKINRILLPLLILMGITFSANAQTQQAGTYFPYPIVPDSIPTFQGRCNYLSDHFFDFCELSKAFSARQKMANEMKVYLSVVANAEPERAIRGVNNLMKKLEKQPKDQLFIAEIAESQLYSDTAELWIDELYLPFAEAVAANKRVGKAEKARFQQQATILRNSLVGKPAPSLPYTRRDGSEGNLLNDSAEVVLVFFNDPDCNDCNMARIRLDADVSMTELISEGKVKVVAISLAEPDDEWRRHADSFPASWEVGAAPDADLTIDLRSGTPDFYIIDGKHNIRYKHLNITQVLDVARQLKKR